MPGGGGFGGQAGPLRMFNEVVGGQISWLLPLALLIVVAAALFAASAMRRRVAVVPAVRGGWLLWGGWLLVNAVVFSFASGIFHSYYTTMLAPAIGALVGAGTVELSRHRRGRVAAAGAVVVSAAWAWALISRDTSWHGWLRYAVLAAAITAIALLLAGTRTARTRSVVAVAVLVPALLAPGTWSLAHAFGPPDATGVNPAAGPSSGFGGRMPPAGRRDGSGDGPPGPPPVAGGPMGGRRTHRRATQDPRLRRRPLRRGPHQARDQHPRHGCRRVHHEQR
ncbi:hypothetical protein GCM10010176_078970 [Nonomuraea spiralis]|nr:hypothetical protein GCM10010176_078970 [Nonomuraea spiralis]